MSTNNLVSVYTKAHDWWTMKSESDRSKLFNKYFPESKDTATIGHIAEIWDKENSAEEKTSGFSEGEWTYHNDNNPEYFDVECEGDRICSIYAGGESLPEAEANAKLIASAPQLYRENKEMKELLQRIADYEVTGEGFKEKLLSVSNLAAMLLFKLNNPK